MKQSETPTAAPAYVSCGSAPAICGDLHGTQIDAAETVPGNVSCALPIQSVAKHPAIAVCRSLDSVSLDRQALKTCDEETCRRGKIDGQILGVPTCNFRL